jgi:predicted RNA-binding Zn-ribbon protein involved in translation (DUF1610 family)
MISSAMVVGIISVKIAEWNTQAAPTKSMPTHIARLDKMDNYNKPCLSREHEPPTLLYIEPGKQHRHECPSCGKVTIMKSPDIYWC